MHFRLATSPELPQAKPDLKRIDSGIQTAQAGI
jgi:hypothetical protein